MRLFLVVTPLLAVLLSGCIAPEQAAPPADDDMGQAPMANVTRDVFYGRLVCGVGTPVGTLNPCLSFAGNGNVFAFTEDRGLESLLVGLTWDPTTTFGKELQLLVESRGFNAVEHDDEVRYGSDSGAPDLMVRVDASELEGTEWSWEESVAIDLQVRVFPARTFPPSLILDQRFEVHVAAYYGAPAPEEAQPFPAGHGSHWGA